MRTSHYAHMSRVFEEAIEYSRGCLVSSAKQIRSKRCFFRLSGAFFLVEWTVKGEAKCSVKLWAFSRVLTLKKFDFSYFPTIKYEDVMIFGLARKRASKSKTFKDAVDLFLSDINLFTG